MRRPSRISLKRPLWRPFEYGRARPSCRRPPRPPDSTSRRRGRMLASSRQAACLRASLRFESSLTCCGSPISDQVVVAFGPADRRLDRRVMGPAVPACARQECRHEKGEQSSLDPRDREGVVGRPLPGAARSHRAGRSNRGCSSAALAGSEATSTGSADRVPTWYPAAAAAARASLVRAGSSATTTASVITAATANALVGPLTSASGRTCGDGPALPARSISTATRFPRLARQARTRLSRPTALARERET